MIKEQKINKTNKNINSTLLIIKKSVFLSYITALLLLVIINFKLFDNRLNDYSNEKKIKYGLRF